MDLGISKGEYIPIPLGESGRYFLDFLRLKWRVEREKCRKGSDDDNT